MKYFAPMANNRSVSRLSAVALYVFASSLCALPSAAQTGSPGLVISQVYGAGGNTGAVFTNDFIQIFNRGAAAVSLAGTSLQYASATGTGNFGITNQITVLPSVTLSPGQYYLVKEAGGAVGVSFAADLVVTTGAINMSGTAGKVALVNSATSLGCNGGSTPCSAAQRALILDLVGYGSANFFEGSAAAPALSATTSALRAGNGCTDSDNNASDFTAAAVSAGVLPRTSSSPLNACGTTQPTPPTAVGSASPSSVSAGDSTTLTVTVTPGANPTSTGIAVTANLSAIGGGAAQPFADAGGGTFTFAATVGAGTPTGAKSLPVSVTDAQGRTGSASISLTVTAPVPRLAIHAIQGSDAFSPWAGQLVQTEGLVTAVKSNGFFVQAPDFEGDADPATSEGIFVFTSSAPPAAAAVGNRVQVRGFVQDFIPSSDPLSPPLTEIAGAPSVTQLSTGNPLPAPVTLTPGDLNPAGDVSQLAKLEGMRVHVDTLTVVAPTGGFINEARATATTSGVFFGVLPGTPRPFREAGIEAPAVAPAGVPQFDANPERLRVDSDGQVGATAIDVATGATVGNLTGVLDFGSRTYTLAPDPGAAFTVSNNGLAAAPVRAGVGEGEITVASFNMERFYDTVNDPGGDAVLTSEAFALRLNKGSLVIRNVLRMPDVIGVEELENLSALQALAQKIDQDAAAAGQVPPNYVVYAAFLSEGNDVGGIDVGFLVKSSRIEVVDVEQVGKDATYVQPDGIPALLNDRPPLVLKALVKPQGKELPFAVTVIVNHLRSLTGIEGPDGERIRLKRLRQAEFLAGMIEGYQQAGEKVISVGDYNAFDVNDGYVDVINTVRGGPPHPTEDVLGEPAQLVTVPLTDLAAADPAQRYSYVFNGNAQVLDHIIVSQSLAVNEFTYARSNADFPETLRADGTRPERLSDHDVPVAYFGVPRDTIPPTVVLSGPFEGVSYLLGTVPPAACTSTDTGGAGLGAAAVLTVTGGDANGVGSITATCTGAVDKVGNVAADVSVHYRVVAYAFVGFAPPLSDGRVIKAGSTVPVKFQVFDWNGGVMSSTSVIAGIEVARYAACGVATLGDWQPATPTGGTELRFDDGHFIFNWKTTGLAPGCYSIAVRTVDTLRHPADVVVR